MYFIHQAGIYTPGAKEKDASKPSAFYSPCLRKEWVSETKTLRLVNWMQQAHTPCVWKSGVLIYTAFRDLGKGAIEVNQVIHNFGSETLDYFSTPWGGVRKSSLPNTVISIKDGSWKKVEGQWGWGTLPQKPTHHTDGWEAWTQDLEDEASPALAFVFGKGKGTYQHRPEGKRIILWGSAGNDKVRDYQVTEFSTQFQIEQGESITARWYLVSGEFAKVRKRASELAKYSRVARITFNTI